MIPSGLIIKKIIKKKMNYVTNLLTNSGKILRKDNLCVLLSSKLEKPGKSGEPKKPVEHVEPEKPG